MQCTKNENTIRPLKGTILDFWRMVRQLNCNVIVMLAKEIEAGRVKCERYWPNEGEQFDLGFASLKLVSQTQKNCYFVRQFVLEPYQLDPAVVIDLTPKN